MVTITHDGKTVSKSQNLRGILYYAKSYGVKDASVTKSENEGALVAINFGNGAQCTTDFADYSVAVDFIKARRSWNLFTMHEDSQRTTFEAGL